MEKTDTEAMQTLNGMLEAFDLFEPLVPFEDVGKDITADMREGLALAYAIPGFRKLLSYKYNRAVKLTALASVGAIDQAAGKARALTYKEILSMGRQMFVEYDTIKRNRKQKDVKKT